MTSKPTLQKRIANLVPISQKQRLQSGLLQVRLLTSQFRLLPDFLIIGAAKCGTTSLYDYLTKHPSIVPAFQKEVDFFDLHFDKGLPWYRAHFPSVFYKSYACHLHKRPMMTGEATPHYLSHPHAPRRIATTAPQAKFIVLLRNPVDRAYSHYQHAIRNGKDPLSFMDAIDREGERLQGIQERMLRDDQYNTIDHRRYSYLSKGIYIEQLEHWMKVFPREQFLIIESDDFVVHKARVLNGVMEFLNLEAWEVSDDALKPRNVGNYEGMSSAERQQLADYFEPYNQKLYDFLGVDFGWNR